MAKVGLILAGAALFAGLFGAQAAGGEGPETARLRKLLKSIAPVCLAAKTPGDLDKLQARLAAANEEPSGRGDPMLAAELAGGRKFVSRWRAFLQARKQGGKKAGYKVLEELLQDRTWLTLVPRSKVLERYQEQPTFFYVRYSTRTIEDFWKAIEEFERLEREAESPGMMRRSIEPLEKLKEVWEARSNGNVHHQESSFRPSPSDSTDVAICKQLMLAHVVADYLKLDERYVRAPGAGETAARYLAAQIRLARKNRDLVSLWRMENYLAFLNKGGSAPQKQEIKAIGYCLAGQKFEKEGKYADALRSYRLAMQFPASEVALEFAGSRLRDMAQAHADVYQFGMNYLDPRGESYKEGPYRSMTPRSELDTMQERSRSQGMPERDPWTMY